METDDIIIDLSHLRRIIRGYWKVICLGALIGAALGAAAFVFLPNSYTTEAKLLPAEDSRGLDGPLKLLDDFAGPSIAGTFGGSGGNEATFNLEYLNSNSFISLFIDRFNINALLFPKIWDAEKKDWIPNLETDDQPTTFEAVRKFRKRLSVNHDRRTGVIMVSFTGSDPENIATTTNNLIQFANQNLREKAIDRIRKQQEYLNSLHENETLHFRRQIIRNLIEKNLAQLTIINSNDDYAFRVIDPAYIPDSANHTIKALISLLLIILGSIFGLGYAFYRDRGRAGEA